MEILVVASPGAEVYGPLWWPFATNTERTSCSVGRYSGRDHRSSAGIISPRNLFSANDAILQCSKRMVSAAARARRLGRLIPEMQAIWSGSQPDPHRASGVFRQAQGNLDFANMPLSADFSRLLAGPAGRSMYADFRPDVDWPGQYDISYRTLATNIVNQVRERAPRVPVLNAITHNHYAYRNVADPGLCAPRCNARRDAECLSRAGLREVGATLKDVADEVLAMPAAREPFICEGAIFDLAAGRAEIGTLTLMGGCCPCRRPLRYFRVPGRLAAASAPRLRNSAPKRNVDIRTRRRVDATPRIGEAGAPSHSTFALAECSAPLPIERARCSNRQTTS